MNMLDDIIQRCHERHAEREGLRQRKTVVTPVLYKRYPYQVKVYCARANVFSLDELEDANISFFPIGHALKNEQAPLDSRRDRFRKRKRKGGWRIKQWNDSWGLQIYTGIPSERAGARWHDFEFTYKSICDAPSAVVSCIEVLLNTHANPLLTLTRTGGLRFSCRIQDYLHPNTDQERFFIYKHKSAGKNDNIRVTYLEVVGDKGFSEWDMRYEILLGDLLNPPIITKEVLFAPIDKLRDVLHEPNVLQGDFRKTTDKHLPSLGSFHLNLAKEALLKRGFTYLRKDEGFHHWIFREKNRTVAGVKLWEDQEIVWISASTSDIGIPVSAIPITEIWKDTGIPSMEPIDNKVQSIREGNLSPLAIKRPLQRLHKQKESSKQYRSIEEQTLQLQQILERDTRILALTTTDAGILHNTETESYLLDNYATCLNIACRPLADVTADRYRSNKVPGFVRWRSKMYRWDQAKQVPEAVRLANPFQHGNVCEMPEHFHALKVKGANVPEIICPQCQVYTECQERGHLSQLSEIQEAKAKISPIGRLFLDPYHSHLLEQTLGSTNEQEHICIIDERKTLIQDLFVECELPIKVVQEWRVNWKDYALGKFAVALLNTLELQSEPYSNPIGQIRAIVEAFKQHEDELIQQMCYINIRGKVVAHKITDPDTGVELSHYAIVFQDGTTAHIPLDADAKDRLCTIGLRTISPRAFSANTDIRIEMNLTEAIRLGILDAQTVESIELLPTVCRNPEWTYWHQLKRFFDHYKRDVDAPMQWRNDYLHFWLPPIPHPNIKRLLFITPFFNEKQLRKVFPDEKMDVIRVEPTAWLPGNKVFQIRTDCKSIIKPLNYDRQANIRVLTKIGERYFLGIRSDIERDLSIKHGIITNSGIVKKLSDLAEMSNVCFIESFKSLLIKEIDYEGVDVLWLVGSPSSRQRDIWKHAQMLFGNDEKPLNYDDEIGIDSFNDERIQEIHQQNVFGFLTQAIGRFGMHRSSGKTVMLLNNIEVPDITDRPQTTLFDWEDFEIAGGLDNLEETIRTRERFEAERDNLTADSSRKEVERILGCSSRQANRVLNKLRGGNITRVSIREQILFLLTSGREKTTASFVAAIDNSPQAIGNELKRLLNAGEIVRVRRGVYSLADKTQMENRAVNTT